MEILNTEYKVIGTREYYGVFNELEDAIEHAEEIANEINDDLFIEKTTTEIIDCVIVD